MLKCWKSPLHLHPPLVSNVLTNGDTSRTCSRIVSLGSNDLVIEWRPQVHSSILPCIEVVCCGDGTTAPLRSADGPELMESCSPHNGWFVGTSGFENLVSSSITWNCTVRCAATRCWSVVFNDVVLDERVFSPAVHGKKDSPGAGAKRARESYGSERS